MGFVGGQKGNKDMTTIFLVLGALLATFAALPYIRDVLRGMVRPRLVSWGVWAALMALMTITAIRAHEPASAMLSAVTATECLLVVIIGWRAGNRSLGKIDKIALIGAVVGLTVMMMTSDALLAMIVMLSVDAVAYIPTIKHAWDSPEEESMLSFGLSLAGGILCLTSAVMSGASVAGLAYPIYSVVFAGLVVGLLAYGRTATVAPRLVEEESEI